MEKGRLDTAIVPCFLALVRSGLHGVPLAPAELDLVLALAGEDWRELARVADVQAVTGLIQSAVELLSLDIELPPDVEMTLVAETARIERGSAEVERLAHSVIDKLCADGFHPVVLKGPSVAALYPAPLRRNSGDIDIYLPEAEFEAAAGLLGADESAPDGSRHCSSGGIDIDLHRRYYDLPRVDCGLPQAGSPEGVLLMLSAHIFKHACGAGVGLRQFCDYARARAVLEYNAEILENSINAAGLSRWGRLLDSFTDTYLSTLGADVSLYDKLLPNPRPLLKYVFKSGNFGFAGDLRAAAASRPVLFRKTDTFLRILGRLPFSLHYAPRVALSNLSILLRGNFAW